MNKTEKRVLDLLAAGKLTAIEANQILKSMDHRRRESRLILEIKSSEQSLPLLSISLPVNEVPILQEVFGGLAESSFAMQFRSGDFVLDFRKLDWTKIIELASKSDADNIYFMESKDPFGKEISLSIQVIR